MPKPNNILVIDDEPSMLEYLTAVLQKEGYTVRQAINAHLAFQTLAQFPPDLILLDVTLEKRPHAGGGFDGHKVCTILKKDPATRHIPIIFLTATREQENRLAALKAGAVDYITKPFDIDEILLRVNAQLELVHQRQLLEEQNQQLRALRERERQYYQEMSQQKDQFVRSVAHDLRSPAGAILGYVHILQDSPHFDEQERVFLEKIANNAEWMTQFIQSLLDLTRIEAGAPLHLEWVGVNAFLRSCLDRFSILARDKGLDLNFEALAPDLQIEIDHMRMSQVVNNLLGNAIKYTPSGGQVLLRAERCNENLILIVEDSGYGIPAVYLPQVFDKFFRVPQRQHREQEGTGLGLSIVKAIVEQHGGQVQVESQEGQGSRFSILLPIKRPRS